jgi:hypothetical protein
MELKIITHEYKQPVMIKVGGESWDFLKNNYP